MQHVINQSNNQFINVIAWDKVPEYPSGIKRMTKIVINNNTIHENNNGVKAYKYINYNKHLYIRECKKYLSYTLLLPPFT